MLTVLTDPVPTGRYAISEPLKKVARQLRSVFRPPRPFTRSAYRGHFAVTRSLVEGLAKIGVNANYAPLSTREVAPTVVVLSGIGALSQAVEWRREGRISRLIAGPNLVDFPSDIRSLLTAAEVDLCITPSPLVCATYIDDCPELAGRCASWPAGVDSAWWAPDGARDSRRVLVYEKQQDRQIGPIVGYVRELNRRGFDVTVLQYGSYLPAQYRELLRRSSFMIGFSEGESQGIAWSEAWSTGVPTLMWNQTMVTYRHPRASRRQFRSSSAPYLTEACGSFFWSREEFPLVLDRFLESLPMYRPREWVLEYLSDEASARQMCTLAGVSY